MSIAVCTPTRNRRWTWEWSKMCLDSQDVESSRIHWIIVDNSDLPDYDWSPAKEHPRVTYCPVSGRETIGQLRNRCLDLALQTDAEYIVFWDDDDFYPSTRISSGIRALHENPGSVYSGCNELTVLLIQENRLVRVGPYPGQHSTAASWTIRRSYAEAHRFDPTAKRAEETSFTEQWKAPMAHVTAEETILVMGHGANTVNKSEIARVPERYLAHTVNSANGRMVMRVKWFHKHEEWDRFRSTFLDASNKPPRDST